MPVFRQIQNTITPSGQGVRAVDPGRPLDLSPIAQGVSDINQAVNTVQLEAKRRAKEQEALDRDTDLYEARSKLDQWERATVHDPKQGLVTLRGRDAFEIPTVLAESFDKFADTLVTGARDKRSELVLRELVRARREQVMSWADRHTLRERDVFHETRYQADLVNFEQNVATFAADPARVRAEIEIQADRTVSYLKSKGQPDEEIQRALKDNASRAHVAVLNRLIDADNPEAADAYLKLNAGSINAPELLRASKAIEKQMDTMTGVKVATEVVQQAVTRAQPSDIGRLSTLAGVDTPSLNALVIQAESAGRRYGPDGKTLLTSPKGALGEQQVMPKTATDPGFGIKPAARRPDGSFDPDDLARVGREYLAAMVKRYAGNVPLALAAYNAGPGAVDKAVKAMERDATELAKRGRAGDWLSYMPKETQDYVAKIAAAYAGGQGQPPKPTLQEIQAGIRERISPNRPEALKVALTDSARQFEEMQKAEKQRGEEAMQAAMMALQQNGGRVSLLPARVRAAVPPEKMDDLMNYGARVAKGDDITDPIVFQKMATDDAWIKSLSDAEFFNQSMKLSEADRQQMALRRGKLLNPTAASSASPMELNYSGINSLIDNRLRAAGQDPTPKDGGDDAKRIGAMRKVVWDQIAAAQLSAGKKLTDVELAREVDNLFATNMEIRSFWGNVKTQPLLTAKPGDIPEAIKAKLKEDFKKQGVTDPSDADLLGAYMNLTFAARRAPALAAVPPTQQPRMNQAPRGADLIPGQGPPRYMPPPDTPQRQSGVVQ